MERVWPGGIAYWSVGFLGKKKDGYNRKVYERGLLASFPGHVGTTRGLCTLGLICKDINLTTTMYSKKSHWGKGARPS